MNSRKSNAAPSPGTVYIWNAPGKAVSVHLDHDVIDRMLPDIMRGFGSVPRRGAEVGGILLGTHEPGNPLVVSVTDFENVPCEHERGPSFILSSRDLEAWREAYERFRSGPGRDTYAVGYYRSHTREGLYLAPEDLGILAQFFPAPNHVALLVKPYASRNSEAAFFFYEDGSMRSEEPYLVFPFSARELPAPAPVAPAREVPAPRIETQPEPPPAQPLPQQPGPQPGRRRSWLWLAPVVAVLLAFVAFEAFRYVASGSIQLPFWRSDSYPLGLAVTISADNLHLTWNRQAPAIRSAVRGVLRVSDGDATRDVELSPALLRNGSISYRHLSDKVVLKIEVFSNERSSIAETLRLQLTRPGPPPEPRIE